MMRSLDLSNVLLFLMATTRSIHAIYVSYDDAKAYREGDLIPFVYNKLTSSRTMASMDLSLLETCGSKLVESTAKYDAQGRWSQAIQALHGDVYRSGPLYEIRALEDAYCEQLCVLDLDGPVQYMWQDAVRDGYHYNTEIDGMPVASRSEDDFTITTRYWGGSPLGRTGANQDGRTMQFDGTEEDDVYVYNHWNIEMVYEQIDADHIQVIRTTVQPYSIRHQFRDDALGVNIFNPIGSCVENADNPDHTDYTMVADRPPQKAAGKVLFTYDVIWREYEGDSKKPAKKRWNVFLTLDGAIPLRYQMASIVFSVLVNVAIWGTLVVWVLRDLSYRPHYEASDETDGGLTEKEKAEVALWPLSERVFVPPRRAPNLLAVFMGVGTHLLLTSILFLIFFRLGIVNQSLGARMITPVVIMAVVTTPAAGYVTARLCRMFGSPWQMSLFMSFLTAILYPLTGIISVGFCYDVFPGPLAPSYQVLNKSLPIIFVWIWIMIPLTVGGGWFGHRAGSLQAFPITTNLDIADLEICIEDEVPSDTWIGFGYRCWKAVRTPFLFILGGVLPVLCGFAAFSYGVAGPIFLGYYTSTKLATLAPYFLFLLCSAGVAVLMQYRQLRIQQHAWWWAAFVTGSSSGLHIWLLALSWLFFNTASEEVSAGTFATHLFWFAYIGFGVAILCGSVAVAACLLFHIIMYRLVTSKGERQPMLDDHDHDGDNASDEVAWEDHQVPHQDDDDLEEE
eukprot:scaffold34647_cov182-Amphora_coffeaeformis.AAC.5